MKLKKIKLYPSSVRLIYQGGKCNGKYIQLRYDVFEKYFVDMLSNGFEFEYVCENYGVLWGFNF